MSDGKIRVLIAEDHVIASLGIAALVDGEEDMVVVARAESGNQAVQLYRDHQPDVVLMDMRLPRMDGAAATGAICRQYPEARVLILSHYEGEEDIRRAMQSGAKGYLKKDAAADVLLTAIRKVAEGQKYLPPELAERISDSARAGLTKREQEILQLIFEGLSNQEIANALEIGYGTVRIHVSNLILKLGAKRRTEAVSVALKKGLLQPE